MKIKTIYACPVCKNKYYMQSEAIACKNKHEVTTEKWLMCKCGYGVRWYDNVTFESTKMMFDNHVKNRHRD